MASDDRPDDRPRFTLRRFLSPDDEPTTPEEPTEPASVSESFGTGDVDDDALDAIVQGAGPSALVWGADEVPDPVPGDLSLATPSPPDVDDSTRSAGDDDDWMPTFESAVLDVDDEPDDSDVSVLGALADAIEPDDLDPEAEADALDGGDPEATEVAAPEALPESSDETPGTSGPVFAAALTDSSTDEDDADSNLPDADVSALKALEPDPFALHGEPMAHDPEADDPEADDPEADDPEIESASFIFADPVPDVASADVGEEPSSETPEAADPASADSASEAEASEPEPVETPEAESDEAPKPVAEPIEPEAVASDPDDVPPEPGPEPVTFQASADAESAVSETSDPEADADPEAVEPEPDAVEPVVVDAATEAQPPSDDSAESDPEPDAASDSPADEPQTVVPEAADPTAAADAESVADTGSEPEAAAPEPPDLDDPDSTAEAAAAEPESETADPSPTPASADSSSGPEPEAIKPETVEPEAASDEDAPEANGPSGDGSGFHTPLVAAVAAPLSDPLPPDPDPSPMETAEIDADLATAETTAAVDDAFDVQTDPAKPAGTGADGIEGDLEVTPLGPDDFEPGELRAVLRTMMTSRKLDEKMLTLLKQGKGFFHIGSAGHEASQTAVAQQFEGGSDWFCFYYRDLATALTVGLSPADVFRAHYGKADDPFGGGRQMPEHFGHRELNILSTSSSVGAQYVPAVGFALACKREDGDGPRRAVYTSGGEGSTSQGAFHEALNWAAREALPVLFHIQDNKYAISVPVEEQTAGGSIWHLLGGYAGLRRLRYDGTDFFQSAAAARAAMDHIRAGLGPVALHADLVRLLPHSSSDDHKKYREAASLEADAARDPIPRLAAQLVEAGVMTDDEVEALRAEVAAEIDRLAKVIEKEADPDPATATDHVYYEGPDAREYEVDGPEGDLIVMVDAINHALDEEMSRDERVLVYGEDVGGGKGGVFTATRGLTAKHGRDRCFNSPLAEHSVLGSAVGLAAAGYKPVVEIQFADYIWPGMQPLRNQIASMRYRSNGAWACPMVIRIPAGGYIHGGLCHSQNIEAIFGHFPGLHVVMPSNAADAKGLLKTAIRGEDPVLFLEHKALYRQGPARRPEPHDEYLVPLGKAAVPREGTDLTIVTWGAIVYKALAAAKALEKEGVSVEVIDVRSFLPFDSETVLASVKKTGRVLIAYEDHEFMGFGAEIAAQVADGAFGYLDAPVKRVAGAFSSIPYADPLEKAVLPQDADVLEAAREVLAY